MRVTVLGCGLVGTELARALTADGHSVLGTTTTPQKVDTLSEVCAEVAVVRGSDPTGVARALAGADAVVVTAGPSAARAMSVAERAATYHEVLVRTAEHVVAGASPEAHLVALSSLSVYGSAADHLPEVTEDAPVTQSDDPSPRMFLAMEQIYRARGGATIFRCADIFGGQDPPMETKITMAHQVLGGSIPFKADALFYRVHVDDVVAAIAHAITNRLTGTFNLTHEAVPPRNAELFDAIGARLGFGPLAFRGELEGPAVPVSVAKLLATGFRLRYTRAPAMSDV